MFTQKGLKGCLHLDSLQCTKVDVKGHLTSGQIDTFIGLNGPKTVADLTDASNSDYTWNVHLSVSDRYSEDRPCHQIPYLTQSPTSGKTIRKWRIEVQDSANPSFVTGALGLMVISPSHGILLSSHPCGVRFVRG